MELPLFSAHSVGLIRIIKKWASIENEIDVKGNIIDIYKADISNKQTILKISSYRKRKLENDNASIRPRCTLYRGAAWNLLPVLALKPLSM